MPSTFTGTARSSGRSFVDDLAYSLFHNLLDPSEYQIRTILWGYEEYFIVNKGRKLELAYLASTVVYSCHGGFEGVAGRSLYRRVPALALVSHVQPAAPEDGAGLLAVTELPLEILAPLLSLGEGVEEPILVFLYLRL